MIDVKFQSFVTPPTSTNINESKKFLTSKHRSPNLTQAAFKTRGPPRLFGYTKSQVLDTLMRSNATICATIAVTSVPLACFMIYRYQYVLKPRKIEYEKMKQEELLSEGAFHKS